MNYLSIKYKYSFSEMVENILDAIVLFLSSLRRELLFRIGSFAWSIWYDIKNINSRAEDYEVKKMAIYYRRMLVVELDSQGQKIVAGFFSKYMSAEFSNFIFWHLPNPAMHSPSHIIGEVCSFLNLIVRNGTNIEFLPNEWRKKRIFLKIIEKIKEDLSWEE